MDNEILEWFDSLKKIQKETIGSKLCNYDKDIEYELTDFSYELVYRILELIDGYYNDNGKYLMEHNGKYINKSIDLHNLSESFLLDIE